MFSRRVLGDVALALLAVLALAFAAYVVVRDPSPPTDDESLALPADFASPSASPSPTASPSTGAAAVDALLLRSPGSPGQHVVKAGQLLGWRLSGGPLEAVPASATSADVVVLQAGASDAAQVRTALDGVHRAAPAVRLVVLGPLAPGGDVAALQAAATADSADFFDPLALGWLPAATGTPAPAALATAGERLADVLR